MIQSRSMVIMAVVLLLLAACATVGERKAKYAEASYAEGHYDEAFDFAYESLAAEPWNDRPIRLFPELVTQVRRLHQDRIRAERDHDWDAVARSYDRLKVVNERVTTVQQWHAAERAQGGKRFSSKVSGNDLDLIANLPLTPLEPGFKQAHEQAAEGHYQRASNLAATGNYRQSVVEFRVAEQFSPGFRDAGLLALRNEQLANEKDAGLAYQQGNSFAASKQYRSAQQAFESALGFVPEYRDARVLALRYKDLADQADAKARYQEGAAYAARGEYRSAATAFATSLQFVADYKDARQQQQHYTQLANEQEAAAFYEQGLKSLLDQDYDAAEQAFNQAEQRIPGYKDARLRAQQAHAAITPDTAEIDEAIREALQQHIPLEWLGVRRGHTEKIQLRTIDVEWVGPYDMRWQRWPASVEVEGDCELEQAGQPDQPMHFHQTATFHIQRLGSHLIARVVD